MSAVAGRNGWLILGALGLLMIAIVWLGLARGAPDNERPIGPRLSIYSNDPRGARALYLWLDELGFNPTSIERRAYAVPRNARALFLLAPSTDPAPAVADSVVEWVRQGGTLFLVDDRNNNVLRALGADVERRFSPSLGGTAVQPAVVPPLPDLAVRSAGYLQLDSPEWVPLIVDPDQPDRVLAAERPLGRGRAIVLTSVAAVSNAGLRDSASWQFVLHVLRAATPGTLIAFDEYHHGLTESGSLGAQLAREPWGWAVLYAGAVLFLYVALAGKRFGRPLNPLPEGYRRARGEYVQVLGALLHRGDHRGWLRERYVAQAKRALAQRFRARSDQPVAALLESVAERRPGAERYIRPLVRLEGPEPLAEATILQLIEEAEQARAALART